MRVTVNLRFVMEYWSFRMSAQNCDGVWNVVRQSEPCFHHEDNSRLFVGNCRRNLPTGSTDERGVMHGRHAPLRGALRRPRASCVVGRFDPAVPGGRLVPVALLLHHVTPWHGVTIDPRFSPTASHIKPPPCAPLPRRGFLRAAASAAVGVCFWIDWREQVVAERANGGVRATSSSDATRVGSANR